MKVEFKYISFSRGHPTIIVKHTKIRRSNPWENHANYLTYLHICSGHKSQNFHSLCSYYWSFIIQTENIVVDKHNRTHVVSRIAIQYTFLNFFKSMEIRRNFSVCHLFSEFDGMSRFYRRAESKYNETMTSASKVILNYSLL
jgi:hypothetical protein